MPAVCQPEAAKPLNKVCARRGVIKMHGLRIEFDGKSLDVLLGDLARAALEFHAQRDVVKPLDHL